ncbi:MAG: hypothetical protein ABSG13_00585 [Bryobacteraceae bacterium]|jgi:hypothetical protein
MSKALAVCCLALSFAFVVSASDWDKRTVITLHEPLIVAGVPVVTLEPGKYVMRLLNSPSNRHIVQIFNEREDQLFTTVLAIPNYQLEPNGKTIFSFWETPPGNPAALRAWFYPGDNFGQEFVYPKGLAAKIAREAGATVIATPAQTEAELKTAPLAEINKAGEEKPVPEEALAALAPGLPPLAIAPPLEPTPVTLPKTASPFFAVGLAGLLALITGAALRFAAWRAANR